MNFSADKSKKVIDFDIGNKIVVDSAKFYWGIGIFSILFLALAATTLYTVYQWNDFRSNIKAYVSTSVTDSKEYVGSNIKNVNERIATLEKLVEPISILDPTYSVGETLRKLNSEVWRVNEERFNKVEEKVGSMQLELAKAREKLENSDKREVIYISLVNLINKIRTTDPFVNELKSLANASGRDNSLLENLNLMQPYAKEGVPSIHQLSGEFTDIAYDIIKAQNNNQNAGDEKFYERIYNKIASSIKVRKIGYIEGNDVESIVARVEIYLKKSDVARAAAEAEKINTAENVALAEWLKKAEAVKETDRAIANILGYLGGNAEQALNFKHQAKQDS